MHSQTWTTLTKLASTVLHSLKRSEGVELLEEDGTFLALSNAVRGVVDN
jgi:hypothetical protein